MNRYEAYPEYKDSSVGWVGQVPTHWQVMAIKWLTPVCRGASPRPIDDPKYFDDSGKYGWVRISDVTSSDRYLLETEQKLSDYGSSFSVRLPIGSLFLSIAGSVGKPCITGIEACIHDGFVYFPLLKIEPMWLYWIFEAKAPFVGLGKLNTQLNLNTETVGGIKISLPPRPERAKILKWLDIQTARIDTLIAKKTRFIELLKEKRQAVITKAVTKGLDDSVEMKDSGVEWVGQMPVHWRVVQSRRLFKERKERAHEDDVQFTASQKYGVLPQTEFMEREGRRVVLVGKGQDILKHIEPGDFLISMRSFEGGLEECRASGSVSSAYVPLTPIKWIWNPFFKHLFKSNGYIQALQSTSDLVRDGQALRFENFSRVPLLEIPLNEQKQIALTLDRETTRIDTLITKTERSIELLKEKRSALITAAVTGKIDLREAA